MNMRTSNKRADNWRYCWNYNFFKIHGLSDPQIFSLSSPSVFFFLNKLTVVLESSLLLFSILYRPGNSFGPSWTVHVKQKTFLFQNESSVNDSKIFGDSPKIAWGRSLRQEWVIEHWYLKNQYLWSMGIFSDFLINSYHKTAGLPQTAGNFTGDRFTERWPYQYLSLFIFTGR